MKRVLIITVIVTAIYVMDTDGWRKIHLKAVCVSPTAKKKKIIMKEKKIKMKLKGYKKALEQYRDWLSLNYFHRAKIMMDLSDGTVWIDIFTDCNSYNVYHSDTIISLSDYILEREDEGELNMALLKEYGEKLLAGAEQVQDA